MKNATDFLKEGAEVLGERGKQYDQPDGERSMGRAVKAFEVITGKSITEAEGWLFMQILKDVRQWSRPEYHKDSAVDSVNYAALKSEALSRDYISYISLEWIDWDGGKIPVNEDYLVHVMLRNGQEGKDIAKNWKWSNTGMRGDIVKYKLAIKEQ